MKPALRMAAAFVLLATAGCVSLPDEGPVATVPDEVSSPTPGVFDYNPEPPKPGDQPAAIVNGFLDALRETPLTLTAARSFLTAGATWAPSRTIVYDDGSLSTEVSGDQATVRLGATVELDSRGSWLGDPSEGAGLTFDLNLVQEDGEWRISDPPDALIVSRTHFEARFVRYDLHFFDPSARILVPEPVYLPAGDEVPSLLVSGLLAGPDASLRTVERTFYPTGTRLELEVSVEGGIADVSLSEEVLDADAGQLDLALAQLAWTLRQVPGIQQMRVTVDGTPVERTTGASARNLSGWTAYDPAVSAADRDLYALEGRGVVSIAEGADAVTLAPLRARARSLAVSLGVAGESHLAAVTFDGTRVLTRPTDSSDPPGRLSTGTDLLRPVYDRFDLVWLVDRTPGGARVTVKPPVGRARVLDVPGISGEQVTAFELSRDGTRLAAVVDGSVMLARVSRSETGLATSAQAARPVTLGDAGRAVDLAWTTPSTLGVLVRLGRTISQVRLVSVDGSLLLSGEAALEPLFERAVNLVTWPGPDAPVYLQTGAGVLWRVSSTGQWVTTPVPTGLVAPTFAG
ncbi:MAG TPA: LpqB family beta-propeller domain-containing protein [Nocardioidaceae bacterium]|nr:LpqB family beta-propeller domain-containing protein [Nocardioidaceae bacterium]